MEKILIFQSCIGINNKTDAARIRYDPEKGVIDLENAKNMLIDKSGGLSTMRGSVSVASGDYISAYPAGDPRNPIGFYAVQNDNSTSSLLLCVPGFDGAITEYVIRAGLTRNARMDFCYVGGETYYMNGFEHGVIVDGVDNSWPVSQWPRSTTAQFKPTPAGSCLDMLSGMFVIGIGDEIQYTEPGLFGIVDDTRNWRKLESKVLMVCSVLTGLYVSDESSTYFLPGRNPKEWTLEKVLDYPATGRAPGLYDPSFFGFETSRPSAVLRTNKGPVIGLPDGTAMNLIDKKVAMPLGSNLGSIMVVDETTIIQSGV